MIKHVARVALSILPEPRHPSLAGPGAHLGWRLGWIKGWLVRPRWRLKAAMGGPRITVGKRFCIVGKLELGQGPGRIVFGDDVIIGAHCTPFTYAPNALIQVGSRTYLNGTRFGCFKRIEIGNDCIIADARLMDTDFHAVHKGRNSRGATAEPAPVRVGNNVWVAAGSAILKGVDIGDDAVVAFGSVVIRPVPAGRIYGGNPARELGVVPNAPGTGVGNMRVIAGRAMETAPPEATP